MKIRKFELVLISILVILLIFTMFYGFKFLELKKSYTEENKVETIDNITAELGKINKVLQFYPYLFVVYFIWFIVILFKDDILRGKLYQTILYMLFTFLGISSSLLLLMHFLRLNNQIVYDIETINLYNIFSPLLKILFYIFAIYILRFLVNRYRKIEREKVMESDYYKKMQDKWNS